MIMLSAFVQDKEFYKQECHKWINSDEKFNYTFTTKNNFSTVCSCTSLNTSFNDCYFLLNEENFLPKLEAKQLE